MNTGSQFCGCEIKLIFMHIFRADEVGVFDQAPVMLGVSQVFVANATKGLRIVHFGDLGLMGNQIIMEIVGRTMVQAAGVC